MIKEAGIMLRLENGKIIVGVDIGYQYVKTKNFVFENGCKAMKVEASVVDHTMYIDGKYYKVGEGRKGLSDNINSGEEGKLLTYVAIAKEMKKEKISSAKIILAVGLPFANYGSEKQSLIRYMQEPGKAEFIYENEEYAIEIKRVIVFPQCYAAIASRLANMKGEYLIVDIGSKTVDIVLVKDGIPNESGSTSIEKAVIKWIRHIQSELQSIFGKQIPESEIMKVIISEKHNLPEKIVSEISVLLGDFIDDLEISISELGYDMDYTNIIYVGGGALIAKEYGRTYRKNVAYDCDIRANAKGYEFLAGQMVR